MSEEQRTAEPIVEDIVALAKAYQFDELATVITGFVDDIAAALVHPTAKEIKRVFSALRDQRRFDAMAEFAQGLMLAGYDDPSNEKLYNPHIRRQYAQALIDRGEISAAMDVLQQLIRDLDGLGEASRPHAGEHIEALGLLGRAHKQRYVDAGGDAPFTTARDECSRSLTWYGRAITTGAFRYGRARDQEHWPALNFVALAHRAERDGLPRVFPHPGRQLAEDAVAMLLPVASKKETVDNDPWLLASLGEAYLALGDWPNAATWYGRYADHHYISPFMIFGSIRQLIEVWQIDRDGPGGALISNLQLKLSDKSGGHISFDVEDELKALEREGEGTEIGRKITESIFGDARPATTDWLRKGLVQARSVARIVNRSDGLVEGTGFLVKGEDLHPDWSGRRLLLTNEHVLSDRSNVRPWEAIVEFAGLRGRKVQRTFEVDGSPLWSSHENELDVAIFDLVGETKGIEPLDTSRAGLIPDQLHPGRAGPGPCAIVGYPNGQKLSIAWNNSPIMDVGWKRPERREHVYLRYQTPTERGNSGSPIFDRDWGVVGLHRAGKPYGGYAWLNGRRSPSYEANEGVAFKSIQNAVRSGPSGGYFPDVRTGGSTEPAAMQPLVIEDIESLAAALANPDIPEDRIADLLNFERATADGLGFEARSEAERSGRGRLIDLGMIAASKLARSRRNAIFERQMKQPDGRLVFVSEGDSWFQFPLPNHQDTIDHLAQLYPIRCGALAGEEFGQMIARPDLENSVRELKPDGVLLSGGGNDLLGDGKLAGFLRKNRTGQTAELIVSPHIDDAIRTIVGHYREMIARVLAVHPTAKIFCHGYDYARPRPNIAMNLWLFKPMQQLGIDSIVLQRQIVANIIDRFNAGIRVLQDNKQVFYVDCRDAVGDARSWFDELHPTSPGFARVARRFERRIAEAFKGDPRVRRSVPVT